MTHSRRKGARGELELAHSLNSLGMFAHRSQQYCGKAGDADLIVRGLGLHIECKRVARPRINDYIKQARADSKGRPFAVFLRTDGCEWLVIQPLQQWAADSAIAGQAIAAQQAFLDEVAREASGL